MREKVKVRFTCNLGTREAGELSVDPEHCSWGDEQVVSKKACKVLLERNRCEVIETIKAVAEAPAIAEAAPPEEEDTPPVKRRRRTAKP